MRHASQHGTQRGTAMVMALAAAIIPLAVIVGATSRTMAGRLTRLDREVNDERALLAAESGIDAAIYLASTPGGLTSGVPIVRDLGLGMSFTVTPTFLMTDSVDNDNDGSVDEADENEYRVLVVGRYRDVTRRLVAYLGPQAGSTVAYGALTQMNRNASIDVQGASGRIDGHDRNINGSAGPAINDVPGVVVEPPGTVADLLADTPVSDRPRILGVGAAPSFATTTHVTDINATRQTIQNAANLVLTATIYNNLQFGNASTGAYNVIYRAGDVDFRGHTRGAGVMFVTGNLHIQGTFRFDGIIYVLGNFDVHGTTEIYGAVITGPASPSTYIAGTVQLYYSKQAVTQASAALPTKYLAFNGWQEISRH